MFETRSDCLKITKLQKSECFYGAAHELFLLTEETLFSRLDDALMKRKLRGIHYLQSDSYPATTSTHSWHYGAQYPVSQLQYSHYHNSQDNVQCCYTHTPTQCNTMYNITPTTAHNYYYYHPPPHATNHLSTPCQCCQTPPPIQYYRY